jgi:K+-sensing histidine kinase KdpD
MHCHYAVAARGGNALNAVGALVIYGLLAAWSWGDARAMAWVLGMAAVRLPVNVWISHKLVARGFRQAELIRLVFSAAGIAIVGQLILNLIVNAAHAIASAHADAGARGRIEVRTRLEGAHVLLSVGDDGAGIPDDVRSKVFDLFFTTKELGKGTGQGLSISRTIVVDRHGGSIDFDTRVGAGTTFFVRLPVAPRSIALRSAA